MIYLEKCVICEKDSRTEDKIAKYILNLENEKILVCKDCDLRWLHPFMDDNEYKKFYSQDYFEEFYVKELSRFDRRLSSIADEIYFKNRIKKIIKLLGKKNINILDVGCGYGTFLKCAKEIGLNALGIDVSEHAVSVAKEKYKLDAVFSTLFEFQSKIKFDVVHMNHVFEHFTNPKGALDKVKELLKPGGILVMEVPNQFKNIYDILRYMLKTPVKSRYFSLQHPFFWSEKSLRKILSPNGFEILKIRTYDRKDLWIRLPAEFNANIFRIVKIAIGLLAYILGREANIEVFAKLK